MEEDNFAKFMKGNCLFLFSNFFYSWNWIVNHLKRFFLEYPQLFLHPEFSKEDQNILEKLFIYEKKLLYEIKVGFSMYLKQKTSNFYTWNRVLKDLEDELKEVQYEIDRIDVVENESNSKNHPRLKQISLGKKKFNMDYKKGMEFLIENGLVENTPDAVAQFLFSGEGLNKTSIGNYLGEK
jgi:hypothetical protein